MGRGRIGAGGDDPLTELFGAVIAFCTPCIAVGLYLVWAPLVIAETRDQLVSEVTCRASEMWWMTAITCIIIFIAIPIGCLGFTQMMEGKTAAASNHTSLKYFALFCIIVPGFVLTVWGLDLTVTLYTGSVSDYSTGTARDAAAFNATSCVDFFTVERQGGLLYNVDGEYYTSRPWDNKYTIAQFIAMFWFMLVWHIVLVVLPTTITGLVVTGCCGLCSKSSTELNEAPSGAATPTAGQFNDLERKNELAGAVPADVAAAGTKEGDYGC